MERPEAKAAGLKTYNTGRPCKNGHNTYRYTQSGTCAGCIANNQGRSADPTAGILREARAQLVQVKLRAFGEDLEALKAAAHAFAIMRCPVLLMGHVYPGLLPSDATGGTALYKFNCYAEDVEPLRAVAVAMANARINAQAIGEAARRAIVGASVAAVPMAEVPEWAREKAPGDLF